MLALPLQSTVPARVLGRQVSALFAGGQVGGNLSFTDFSKIWQDSAGTTPYTAVEQYVGKIVDKSPNGLVFTQATSAARPVVSARVNLLTKTDTLSDAAWNKLGSSVSANKIIEDTTTAAHSIYQGLSTPAGKYSASCIMKPSGRNYGFIEIFFDSNKRFTAVINLVTGAVENTYTVNSPTGTSVNVVSAAAGEWLVTVTATSVTTSSVFVFTGPVNSSSPTIVTGTPSYTGDGSSGIEVRNLSLVFSSRSNLLYQYVNTATDYDTVGFPKYAKFDCIDDNWVSPTGGGGTAGVYYCGAIQFNKVGAVQTIFSDAGTNSGYKLQLTAANQLQISAGNGTAFTAINTTGTFTAGDVALCEFWDDGTNLGVRLGEGTPVTVARPVVTAGIAQITLGKDNNAASNYAGIGMFEPVWRYGAMPNTTQREAIRAYCRSKAGIA